MFTNEKNRELYLSPSILSANFYDLKSDIEILAKNDIKMLHIDVMDGHFVPNITFGFQMIEDIKKNNKNMIMDVHLMIEEPEKYIERFRKAGADIITIHEEATNHLDRAISQIKETGALAGVSINPATNVCNLKYILDKVDLVLIMSVNPGFGGQKFINYSIEKIKFLKEHMQNTKKYFDIEVDGGINTENVKSVIDAGCNLIVAGSAVFNGNIEENIKKFNNIFKGC